MAKKPKPHLPRVFSDIEHLAKRDPEAVRQLVRMIKQPYGGWPVPLEVWRTCAETGGRTPAEVEALLAKVQAEETPPPALAGPDRAPVKDAADGGFVFDHTLGPGPNFKRYHAKLPPAERAFSDTKIIERYRAKGYQISTSRGKEILKELRTKPKP